MLALARKHGYEAIEKKCLKVVCEQGLKYQQ
jgi:hypothetical protein